MLAAGAPPQQGGKPVERSPLSARSDPLRRPPQPGVVDRAAVNEASQPCPGQASRRPASQGTAASCPGRRSGNTSARSIRWLARNVSGAHALVWGTWREFRARIATGTSAAAAPWPQNISRPSTWQLRAECRCRSAHGGDGTTDSAHQSRPALQGLVFPPPSPQKRRSRPPRPPGRAR